MMSKVVRSRIIFVALIALFVLPALIAKIFLVNNWYESGVTNKGQLIEPRQSYQGLGIVNPYAGRQWQLGYLVPPQCNEFCHQQIYLLGQSHIALGKYQARVTPVLLVSDLSDRTVLETNSFQSIEVNDAFHQLVSDFELVIVDPLGQLVMRYPLVESKDDLINQNKDVLADLRKLLKLSRVG
ncbi:hypothetical protein GCM10007938_25840 [Vibrio zhanjiangensis]|uniref:Cytochrome oxidase biogenesis cluster protein n=1 Tax=Vibrio zhanjiangensis TaxID=1046128 RepID=A0ABQ6EZZ4_9VIBR|nr:hypothetical protein [Vibrio zhanjiangensis]GLT18803.1 hypothetical protein GCM10007938_25840 [Vibrio zhanjiangensis]